jgi:hypothetical protein
MQQQQQQQQHQQQQQSKMFTRRALRALAGKNNYTASHSMSFAWNNQKVITLSMKHSEYHIKGVP